MELGMVHHVAFQVGDYEKTKEFYLKILGFQVLGEYAYPTGTMRLDCRRGDAQLEIFWNVNVSEKIQQPHLGYRHLCFRTNAIYETAAWLREQGVHVEEIRQDPMAGGLLTFFYDPDGMPLELHE